MSRYNIKGKLVVRRRCSNPNHPPVKLIPSKVPTKTDPYGEKYCPVCGTTQTWFIFRPAEDSPPIPDADPFERNDELCPCLLDRQRDNIARWRKFVELDEI